MPVAKKVGRKKATRKGRKPAKPVAAKPRRAAAAKAKPARVSVRAFARTLDVSHTAVQKGIESGRLKESIARDARGPFVADVELATKEWAEGASKAPNNGNAQAAPGEGATLVKAQTEAARERARKMRLENEAKEGSLVWASDVKRELCEAARLTRDVLLRVPDRISVEIAVETDAGRV